MVALTGAMTISSVTATHAALAVALREADSIVVDIAGVTEADLTFIQLLEAARRLAAGAGLALTLAQPAGEIVREVLRRGGFLDDDTSERALFWLQGATKQ